MPKPRKQNQRKAKPRILILCEGEKTEPNYFKKLKDDKRYPDLGAIDVVVLDTEKNTAKELVKEAIGLERQAQREGNPFLETWVVIDRDDYSKHPAAFDQARAKGIFIAFSSICFEYWLLLHFGYTTRAFADCDALIAQLKKSLPAYEKHHNAYAQLNSQTDAAVTHALRLRRDLATREEIERPFELNPYTNVDMLVFRLTNIKRITDSDGRYCKLPYDIHLSCLDHASLVSD